MKIKKIAPVLAAALLLAGCSGNGVKTLKKPSFAKYASEVNEEGFFIGLSEKTSKLMDLFETQGEGESKQVKGFKNGYTSQIENYIEVKASGKSAGGLKFENKKQQYQKSVTKLDKANKRLNSALETEAAASFKNGTISGSTHLIGDDSNVLVAYDPNYMGVSSQQLQKSKSQSQIEIDGAKAKNINVAGKQYSTIDVPATFDFDASYAPMAYNEIRNTALELYFEIPDQCEDKHIKYYIDGEVMTVVAERDCSGTAKYGELEYTSKAKVSYTAQMDFAKLTYAIATEITIDQSNKEGTVKLEQKGYQKGSYVNKDVTIKAVDTAKFTNLDA